MHVKALTSTLVTANLPPAILPSRRNLKIAFEVPLYQCFTYPCYPEGPFSLPKGSGSSLPGHVSLGTAELADAFAPVERLVNYGAVYDRESFGPSDSPSVPAEAYLVSQSLGGISEAEHREIDAAAAEHAARAERVEQLEEFVGTIHPDRLLDIAGNIAHGRYAGPPEPPVDLFEATPQEEPAPEVFTTPVGRPEWIGSVDEAPWEAQPNPFPTESIGETMAALTAILGYVGTAANIYQSFQQPAAPTQAPTYNPVLDWLDGPTDLFRPDLAPANPVTSLPSGGSVATPYAGGCISQRDRRIAAASGVTPEAVDRVLHYARQGRRRRRRMLTKSDIGDISTMKSILGGGEAFKVWLAKATR